MALEQELASLRAENAQLKATRASKLTFRVSEKGALSVYGLQRFPVTLYRDQWDTLLLKATDIRAFIDEHEAALSIKPQAA